MPALDPIARVTREIMTALQEDRDNVTAALHDYLGNEGETAASFGEHFAVRDFNEQHLIVTGPQVNEQAASFLRGQGYTVLQEGEIALVKRRKKASNPAQRLQQAVKGGKKINELKFFNDDYSIRTARKIYQEYVEAPDYRYFNEFLMKLDGIIVELRQRYGFEDDLAPDAPAAKQALFEDKTDSRKAVASAQLDPALIYNSRGEVLGTLTDLKTLDAAR